MNVIPVSPRNERPEKSFIESPEEQVAAGSGHGIPLVSKGAQTVPMAIPEGLVVDDLSNKYTDQMFAALQRLEGRSQCLSTHCLDDVGGLQDSL